MDTPGPATGLYRICADIDESHFGGADELIAPRIARVIEDVDLSGFEGGDFCGALHDFGVTSQCRPTVFAATRHPYFIGSSLSAVA